MGEGDQEKKKRIDLSMSQLAGGGVATLTAATAASYLGVYGTIAGAAIMSVMSTAGTAVAQHYLKESGERARDLAERAKRPSGAHTAAAAAPERAGPDSDAARTRAMPTVGTGTRDDVTAVPGADSADDPATEMFAPVRPDGSADPGATQVLGSVGGPRGPGGTGADAADGGGPEGGEPEQDGWRGWLRRNRMLIIPAVAVFALVMIVILVFELFTGRSLSDTVRGTDTHSGPSLLGGYEQQDAEPQRQEPTQAPTAPGGDNGQQTDQPEVQPSQPPAPGGEQPGGEQPQQPGETEQPQEPAPEPGDGGGEQPDDGTGGSDQGGGTGLQDEARPGARQAPAE